MILSSLAEWGDDQADTLFAGKINQDGTKRTAKDQSAFYWLTEDEMTFNKERNPPPPVTEHHVKLFVDDVCTTEPSLLSSIVRQKA